MWDHVFVGCVDQNLALIQHQVWYGTKWELSRRMIRTGSKLSCAHCRVSLVATPLHCQDAAAKVRQGGSRRSAWGRMHSPCLHFPCLHVSYRRSSFVSYDGALSLIAKSCSTSSCCVVLRTLTPLRLSPPSALRVQCAWHLIGRRRKAL